jgi:hypothetical protein
MALTEGTNCGFVLAAPVADPGGASTGTADTYGFAGEFAAPVDATAITEIGWYCDNATEEADYEVGLYAADGAGGIPGTRLAVAGPVAKGTDAGWKKIAIACAVTGSTTYWIAAQCDNTATATKVDYDSKAGEKEEYISATALPNPWGASSAAANRLLAIYAVYTTAAGGGQPAMKRFGGVPHVAVNRGVW